MTAMDPMARWQRNALCRREGHSRCVFFRGIRVTVLDATATYSPGQEKPPLRARQSAVQYGHSVSRAKRRDWFA